MPASQGETLSLRTSSRARGSVFMSESDIDEGGSQVSLDSAACTTRNLIEDTVIPLVIAHATCLHSLRDELGQLRSHPTRRTHGHDPDDPRDLAMDKLLDLLQDNIDIIKRDVLAYARGGISLVDLEDPDVWSEEDACTFARAIIETAGTDAHGSITAAYYLLRNPSIYDDNDKDILPGLTADSAQVKQQAEPHEPLETQHVAPTSEASQNIVEDGA